MSTTVALPPASEVPASDGTTAPEPGAGPAQRPSRDRVPHVSVCIPMRNEEDHIEACLDAVLAQDHPIDALEVIVVDGASTDRSVQRARRALERSDLPRWQVLVNHPGSTPANLNQALAACRGPYVCRVDARSLIPPNYITRCVELLEADPELVVVGGSQRAIPPADTWVARGIARALNNRLGVGLARYRSGRASGPADTVYLGFFRKELLEDVGGWDERLPTNQDFDLNRRLSRHGVVWFDQALPVDYVCRPSVGQLARQYHRFGRWKVRYWRLTGDRPRPRQVVLLAAPLIAVPAATVLVGLAGSDHRRWAVLGALSVTGLIVLDRAGHGPAPARVAQRLLAGALVGVVGASWTSGVWREVLRGRR